MQLSENGANIRQPLIAEVTRLIDAYAAGVLPGRKAMCMCSRWLLHGAVELSVASSTRRAWSILGHDITSLLPTIQSKHGSGYSGMAAAGWRSVLCQCSVASK